MIRRPGNTRDEDSNANLKKNYLRKRQQQTTSYCSIINLYYYTTVLLYDCLLSLWSLRNKSNAFITSSVSYPLSISDSQHSSAASSSSLKLIALFSIFFDFLILPSFILRWDCQLCNSPFVFCYSYFWAVPIKPLLFMELKIPVNFFLVQYLFNV